MSYKESQERNKRLKKLYTDTKNSYGVGAYFDEDKGRLIEYSCNNKNTRARGNRAIRRKLKNSDVLYQRGKYKKLYDYWWEIT